MVKLIDAVFLWAEDGEPEMLMERVKVVAMQSNWSPYMVLSNSTGRCFGGWESFTDSQRAGHALAVFNWMLRHGVPFEEANAAFMEIDEYADWVNNDQGPFREVYWP